MQKKCFFLDHPDDLLLLPVEKGGLDGKAVLVFVRPENRSPGKCFRTGTSTSWIPDVCDDLAFDSDAYTAAIGKRDISDEGTG